MNNAEALRMIEAERIHSIRENPDARFLREAFDMAKAALKRQIPMEHHHTIVNIMRDIEVRYSICPNCLGLIITAPEDFPRFCPWCGQAIDWKEM